MFIEGQEILDKRYRVIKKLGGGAFGEIYKGKHTKRRTGRNPPGWPALAHSLMNLTLKCVFLCS